MNSPIFHGQVPAAFANASARPCMDSVNGTIAEAAAFFRVSIRTMQEWMAANPPVIGHWKMGRNVTIGEEDVIECWVKRHRGTAGRALGLAEELARKEWRAHLQLARADLLLPMIEDLRRRIELLERKPATRAEDHHQIAA